MPVTTEFRWDIIRDARIRKGLRQSADVWRGAVAVGLDRSAPQQTLIKVLNSVGMPSPGDGYDVDNENVICTEINIDGEGPNTAKVNCHFETILVDNIQWPADAWNIVDSTATTTEPWELDAENHPIIVEYDIPDPVHSGEVIARKQVGRGTKFVPVRSLSIQTLVYGRSPGSYLAAVSQVNDRTWQGLPMGYWLLAGVGSRANSRWPQYTELSFTFITRHTRSWMSAFTFKDETGHPPQNIDPAEAAGMATTDYNTGQISGQGLTVAGYYPMSNFFGIFGI